MNKIIQIIQQNNKHNVMQECHFVHNEEQFQRNEIKLLTTISKKLLINLLIIINYQTFHNTVQALNI